MSLLLLSVLLVSTGYVLLELHHACTGEHCPICANVSHCVATLQVEGSGAVLVAESSRPGDGSNVVSSIFRVTRRMADSPVSRKVKLSD